MKIDLHVHSRHSTRPSQWVLQKIGCPESFTDPRAIYRTARERGMDMVTVADHNTLQGALEIAELPGTFLSVEITSYFPEDGCKVHVLALDIAESQFAEIQRIRENVFDLSAFLRAENITHVCAHPLFGVNDRLTTDHVEQLLLLFKNLEINGARDDTANRAVRLIAEKLTPGDIERMAERQNLAPTHPEPWKKNLTGGSDDHGGLNIARIHTEVPGAKSLPDFLRGIAEGHAVPRGEPARPETMAHNLYAIAYQFYRTKFGLDRYVNKDIFLRFVDRCLSEDETRATTVVERLQAFWTTRRYLSRRNQNSGTVQDICRREAARLICDDPELHHIAMSTGPMPGQRGQLWYRFCTGATNKVLRHFADSLLTHLSGGNLFDVFHTIGSAGALYTVLAPYFLAYTLFNDDRVFSAEVLHRALGHAPSREPKVAHFTDTFYEVNGVAKTLQQSVALARRTGKDMTMVTCSPDRPDEHPGVRNFNPIGVFDLPEYPQQKVFYPPVLAMLRFASEQDFTHIHTATPGPIGLAALLIARLFKLPIHGTYHTQIPQYARQLTGDTAMEDMAWKYTIWYYSQMDLVYAPSQATADELAERGLAREKIVLYPRGVDTELFHPSRRNGFLKRYGLTRGTTLLYVGRISREKNLHLLAEAYDALRREIDGLHLVVTGDGPYRAEMEERLAGTGAVFTGVLDGEDLAACFASADVFVFPSATDTFGNVILEAQASGLPVIVSDCGGPHENMVPDSTGLVTRANDLADLTRAVKSLAADPARCTAMGAAARRYTESRTFRHAFDETWNFYSRAG
ncbi:glycosyl transferase group 1 [Desulfovibrio sp. X2]|uniref:glycosyltransferase n=1 Tax=Desulfovibrio sp. X2 TaxID=941449 RepID=UPI000358BE27|nr:glycosyltransferase [Desulfovibrio sp. X2]EPR41948.1 glycosyl transferase group 1 [Desulfovibrio sp. X2]